MSNPITPLYSTPASPSEGANHPNLHHIQFLEKAIADGRLSQDEIYALTALDGQFDEYDKAHIRDRAFEVRVPWFFKFTVVVLGMILYILPLTNTATKAALLPIIGAATGFNPEQKEKNSSQS